MLRLLEAGDDRLTAAAGRTDARRRSAHRGPNTCRVDRTRRDGLPLRIVAARRPQVADAAQGPVSGRRRRDGSRSASGREYAARAIGAGWQPASARCRRRRARRRRWRCRPGCAARAAAARLRRRSMARSTKRAGARIESLQRASTGRAGRRCRRAPCATFAGGARPPKLPEGSAKRAAPPPTGRASVNRARRRRSEAVQAVRLLEPARPTRSSISSDVGSCGGSRNHGGTRAGVATRTALHAPSSKR